MFDVLKLHIWEILRITATYNSAREEQITFIKKDRKTVQIVKSTIYICGKGVFLANYLHHIENKT